MNRVFTRNENENFSNAKRRKKKKTHGIHISGKSGSPPTIARHSNTFDIIRFPYTMIPKTRRCTTECCECAYDTCTISCYERKPFLLHLTTKSFGAVLFIRIAIRERTPHAQIDRQSCTQFTFVHVLRTNHPT